MQTIINFFGTGVRYWICRIPQKEMVRLEEFRLKNNLYWENMLFDLHILAELGYRSWEDFHLLREGSGWLIAQRNWLEIKQGRKKRKISAEEFMGEGLMFDFFQKVNDTEELNRDRDSSDVLLMQLETGLPAKYEIKEERVELSELRFELQPKWMEELLGLSWVEGIKYNNKELKRTKEDTVIRENRVKLLNDEF